MILQVILAIKKLKALNNSMLLSTEHKLIIHNSVTITINYFVFISIKDNQVQGRLCVIWKQECKNLILLNRIRNLCILFINCFTIYFRNDPFLTTYD